MTDTLFACRYRKAPWAVTLLMDHAKTEWTEPCDAAFRHLGLVRDEAMHLRGLAVLSARDAK